MVRLGKAPASDPPLLQMVGIEKTFCSRRGSTIALDGIDVSVEHGEFLTILGPSGCGKTTLLRILAGFERPDAGQVLLDGRTITHLPPNKRPLAMVFQNFALFPHLTVFDNVAYGLRIAKVPKSELRERVEVALMIINLSGLEERLPSQLSGGQQQRVALARSIVIRPQVLLLDEPLSNLDARLREQMRSELRRIQRQLGITTIYVTHDQSDAMAMSDRIVVMNDGRIEQVGMPTEVYEQPVSLFVADFIGQVNVLEVEAKQTAGGMVTVDVLDQELTIGVATAVPDGRLSLVIRPEDVEVTPMTPCREHRTEAGTLSPVGRVRSREYLGSVIQLVVELRDGTVMIARVPKRIERANSLTEGLRERSEVRLVIPSAAVRAVPRTATP
ncbi:MAG: ABC transporter ATP-binding protein [Egibacteraceae bacterium]